VATSKNHIANDKRIKNKSLFSDIEHNVSLMLSRKFPYLNKDKLRFDILFNIKYLFRKVIKFVKAMIKNTPKKTIDVNTINKK
jgi:hypothetical protein